MSSLLPCPFCHRVPDTAQLYADGDTMTQPYVGVRCREHTGWITVEQWNRRAALASGDEVEQLRAELARVYERVENHTMHRLVCNANHSKPIGGDMCICIPSKFKMLEKEVEQLRKDANRYRYMRDTGIAMHQLNHLESTLGGDRLDAAIDAAIARSTKA